MAIFFILHFIADFLLQTRDVAENKSKSNRHLFIHLGIMFVVFALGGFLYFRLRFNDPSVYLLSIACFLALVNTAIHGLIDRNIWSLYKLSVYMRKKNDQNFDAAKWEYWKDSWFYSTIGLDQLLHILTITIVYSGI